MPVRRLALLAALALGACAGIQEAPRVVSEKDGRLVWSVVGLSDNSAPAVQRDVAAALAWHCLSNDQAIVAQTASPSGITGAFQRWNVLYTCTNTRGSLF